MKMDVFYLPYFIILEKNALNILKMLKKFKKKKLIKFSTNMK